MNGAQNPIGIFDSGIGGLTVANAVLDVLPHESLIYFGDTAHLPYGDKSPEAIQIFCSVITDFLLEQNVKAIIIACNSASSVAYEHVREIAGKHSVPVIDVINPVVNFIIQNKYKKVGVIGTRATIGAGIFPEKISAIRPNIHVSSLATPLLAPMIEAGFVKDTISQAVIDNYLSDERLNDIEALVLACTHYPLIKREISDFYNSNKRKTEILATNEIVARYVKKVLTDNNLIHTGRETVHKFFVSDYTESFEATTKLFYRKKVTLQHSNIFQ